MITDGFNANDDNDIPEDPTGSFDDYWKYQIDKANEEEQNRDPDRDFDILTP